MEYLTGTVIGLLLCFGKGWYALCLLFGGLLALMGFLNKQNWVGSLSFSLFTTALFSISSASNDTLSSATLLGSIYLGRIAFCQTQKKDLRLVCLPALFCCLLFYSTGRNFSLQITLPILFSSIPTFRIPSTSERIKIFAAIGLWLLPIILCIPLLQGAYSSNGDIVYLESGKWANTEKPYTLEGLDIAESYSYSEFLKLLGGKVKSVNDLNAGDRIAWLVMPTKPFSKAEENQIQEWVKHGGHLITVSDHTDLFGHGRTLNGLLKSFSADVTYTATMTDKSRDPINYSSGGVYSLLTANTVEGRAIWPIATDLTFIQEAYYAQPNFFGPMEQEGNEAFSRWIVMGSKSVGRGQVTFVTDSTIFSNFAVFQPGTEEFIKKAQGINLMAKILPWLPWVTLASVVLALLVLNPTPLPVCLLGLIALASTPSPPLKWDRIDTIWSGDPSLVLEDHQSQRSFTTAFSIAVLSGSRPHWHHNVTSTDHGVWVSQSPPPNTNWKWLSPELNKDAEIIPHDQRWDELIRILGGVPILGWQTITNGQTAKAGSIWTNDRMGNWWYDRGLSPSRKLRFQSFLDWLANKPTPKNASAYFPPTNSISCDWFFKMANGDGDKIIRAPKLPDTDSIYLLGDGISAQMVKIKGKDTFISVSPWMEYWEAPSVWTATEK